MDKVETRERQLITGLRPDQINPFVLVCGDPARTLRIAQRWDEAEQVCNVREFVAYSGRLGAIPITVASTGIGGPSTAILIEELANCGASTLIRVGNSGAIADRVQVGEYVVTKATLRDDGTSASYAWPGFPASTDPLVYLALTAACEKLGKPYHGGITWCMDGFYSENRTVSNGVLQGAGHQGFVLPSRRDRLMDVVAMGALNCEMETGVLLTLCNLLGLRGGCICTVSDRVPWSSSQSADVLQLEKAMDGCIDAALEAVRILYEWDAG